MEAGAQGGGSNSKIKKQKPWKGGKALAKLGSYMEDDFVEAVAALL
jgi:hypothetical protein